MTPVIAARRRVEEFAALVDGRATPGTAGIRYADLLELVGTLREGPAVEARPAFVLDLRERLVLAAETALVPVAAATTERLTLPVRRAKRDRRIAAAVGGLALVGATTSMAMAAQSALPGDVLYPVKRGIENVQTGVSVGDGPKGESLLENASGRLTEVGELSRGGDLQDNLAIADTLNAFTDQATQASDLLLNDYAQTGHEGSISDLRDFTSDSLDELTALEALVPDDARDELMHAANVVFEIDAAAHQACPTCAGAGITEVPNVFAPVSSGTTGALASSTLAQAPGTKPARGGKKPAAQQPVVPGVAGGSLPAGSVLDPGPETGGDTATTPPAAAPPAAAPDPIEALTHGLTGGGASQPTTGPQPPDPDDVVDQIDDAVDGVTGPLIP